jgi:hypothetical protein
MILVVGALVIIPHETTKLLKIMRSHHTHTYTGEKRHVIVYAQDGCDVSAFIREFFHKERALRETDIALVTNTKLSDNTKQLLVNPQYRVRVDVLKGDLFVKENVKRANVSTAEAVFLVAPKHKQLTQIHHTDAQAILIALNLKTYNPNLEVFIQVVSHEHKLTALSRGLKHVICVQELKLRLLAQNILYPGFSTLVSNLIYSASTTTNTTTWKYNPWLHEYDKGLEYIFYTDQDLTPFVGMTFVDVALYLYRHCHVTLLGVKTRQQSDNNDTEPPQSLPNQEDTNVQLLLNPGKTYVLRSGDVGIVMATHERAIDKGLAQHPLPSSHDTATSSSSPEPPLRITIDGAEQNLHKEQHRLKAKTQQLYNKVHSESSETASSLSEGVCQCLFVRRLHSYTLSP